MKKKILSLIFSVLLATGFTTSSSASVIEGLGIGVSLGTAGYYGVGTESSDNDPGGVDDTKQSGAFQHDVSSVFVEYDVGPVRFGVDYFLVDRLGIIQDRFQSDNDLSPVQGENVILTINSNIQKYVEDSIVDFKGAVIIMDPKNGEIISLASSPNYNLSSFIGPIPINTWKKLT